MFSLTSASSPNAKKKAIAIVCLNGIPGLLLLPVIFAFERLVVASFFLLMAWLALFCIGILASSVLVFRAISKMRRQALALADSPDSGTFNHFAKRLRRFQVSLVVCCFLVVPLVLASGYLELMIGFACSWSHHHEGCLSFFIAALQIPISVLSFAFHGVLAWGVLWPKHPQFNMIVDNAAVALAQPTSMAAPSAIAVTDI